MSALATQGPMTFEVADGNAISRYALVKMNAGGDVSVAGATDQVLGIAQDEIAADAADRVRGNTISVLPINHAGAVRLIAAGAIVLGADLFKAASGKVDDSGTQGLQLVAASAAGAADEVITAFPYV